MAQSLFGERFEKITMALGHSEAAIATIIGRQRHEASSQYGGTHPMGTISPLDRHIHAVGAEMAVAKWLNVWPDLDTRTRVGGADMRWRTARIEVKNHQNMKADPELHIKQSGHPGDADVYVLVHGLLPEYTLVGWCDRELAIHDDRLVELPYGMCYVVQKRQLYEMKFLPSRLFIVDYVKDFNSRIGESKL